MAPRSPQPAGGHGLAWELRLGARAGGAADAGPGGSSRAREREAPAGSACQPPAAQAQSGHVALPTPGSPPPPPGSGLPARPPRSHLTVRASRPRGPCETHLPRHGLPRRAGSGVCLPCGNPPVRASPRRCGAARLPLPGFREGSPRRQASASAPLHFCVLCQGRVKKQFQSQSICPNNDFVLRNSPVAAFEERFLWPHLPVTHICWCLKSPAAKLRPQCSRHTPAQERWGSNPRHARQALYD
ncbi:PREDICTED: translation initiation factor IF-2-like [Chinchilla lanigera]|uniref:translation initiation factor IF-2-like n=1 Tax=Chinchilla lanigera TaxID=34839 RepID=UPI0006991D01|nr:PREDICTED: translation initiation factor IF-2-like [Chinchilla lanigera]